MVSQEIHDQLFILGQLKGFVTRTFGSRELAFGSVFGFHLRET
jgi:hypothetical protein